MAFITGAIGALAGGGLFGNIALAAIGIGINLAIAYFFPQKIKGPRAESLKAQTSKYGDHVARIYGTNRTAGAVVWLKGDKVDEHVRTFRQGKALGPEVTEFSYTATFAVAFAWNGPFTAVPRIWADDKLIYDNSAEGLQDIIDNGGDATGVAEGATVTIYLGTDTQVADPDIEADRGAGNVPAWPKVCYVVIKNLPLDEFGIRVPNIEAELVQTGDEEFVRRILTGASVEGNGLDAFGNILAYTNTAADHLTIQTFTSGTAIASIALAYGVNDILVSSRGDVLTWDDVNIYVYDASTGALKQTIITPVSSSLGFCSDEINIGGTTYLIFGHNFRLLCYSNDGTGWGFLWNQHQGFSLSFPGALSIGPEYIYYVSTAGSLARIAWSATGLGASVPQTIPGFSGEILAAFYDDESDSVIIIGPSGQIFVTTPDVSTILRSITDGPWGVNTTQDGRMAKHLKSGSDRLSFQMSGLVVEYRISDLALISSHVIADWGRMTGYGALSHSLTSQPARAVVVTGNSGDTEILFMPRAGRGAVPLADVIDAECRHAGLVPDVSLITTEIKGYGDRNGSAPRGIIEDLQRVNFFDWAQVDGVITFFPRNTVSVRTLTVAETGMVLNAEPDAVQVREDYPAALDVPEQVIIQYTSWDAIYRTGSQAANPEEDQPFPDEPSEADETGFPVKVRRKRALEFSTAQVLADDEAAQIADLMHNEVQDAGIIYKTTVGPKHLDLYPGEVIEVPLDDSRIAKAVITKMSGETLLELELRKRGDSYTSEAVGQPTPYVVDSLLGIASAAPVLIDGHLMRAADNDDAFYAGIAVTSAGQFRSGTLFQSEDGGTSYQPWAAFSNSTIRGLAVNALPDRPHADAFDRATVFTIAVAQGTAPDSVTEAALLASETSNAFAVWNAFVGDWEYIRAASVVDNLDNTWTLSTLLRGRKGTEFAMAGHVIGATVYHLDALAIARATDADRTLSRIYVAVPTSTVFSSNGAVTFTNQGKGLRPWAPQLASAIRDDGTGDWTFTWNRRDRLGQEWPESGSEDPPMSEDTEEYTIKFYSGVTLMGTYSSAVETFVYTAAAQTTDFGSPQTTIEIGVAQVSVIYGDGIELREAA